MLLTFWICSIVPVYPGSISVFSLPNTGTDGASGISSNNAYLCALSFGSGDQALSICGVPFQSVHLGGRGEGDFYRSFSGVDTYHGGTWSVSVPLAGGEGFLDDTSAKGKLVGLESQADGAMFTLLRHMNFLMAKPLDLTNGTTMKLNFGGLKAGTKYSLRYYYCQWSRERYIDFSFRGEGVEEPYAGNPVDMDAGGAAFIEYEFVAATNFVTMSMKVVLAGYGPHFYAVTLQSVTPGTGQHGGTKLPVVAQTALPKVTLNELRSHFGLGSWIWDTKTEDQQKCRLWKSFVVPDTSPVLSGSLHITADDYYVAYLDGRELGSGSGWEILREYDLAPLLKKSGTHVLAIEAANAFGAAGVILGLNLKLKNGQSIPVSSDDSWWIVPNGEPDWKMRRNAAASWSKAKVVGTAGESPWKLDTRDWGSIVLHAPMAGPIVLSFWQQSWVQVGLLSFVVISVGAGIYLTGRLIMNVKEHAVIRRERARIARDLHDGLSAGLTQLVVCGESAKNNLHSRREIQPTLDEMCLKARSLLDSLRETIWIVNSQRDSLRDLVMHLCDYTESFMKPTAIKCRFDVASNLPKSPCDVGIRRNLLLAVNEALCNVIKYSDASELKMRIQWNDREIVVRIEDNGKGFDLTKTNSERNGLINMEQRARDAGGECHVVSRPGAGCQVEIRAPFRRLRHFYLWRKTQPDHNDQLAFPLQSSFLTKVTVPSRSSSHE